MFNLACIWTAVLAVPFGIAALIAPDFVFAQFGVKLDVPAQGVARGYAATALGLGITAFLLRNVKDTAARRALLVGALVFNLAELFAQLPLWWGGHANASIWGTIVGHVIGTVLCVMAMRQGPDSKRVVSMAA